MTYAAQYELQPANYKLALLVTLQQSIAQSPLYSWYWIDTLMGLGAYVRAYVPFMFVLELCSLPFRSMDTDAS